MSVTTKTHLNKELSIEGRRGAVERTTVDGLRPGCEYYRVNKISTGTDRVDLVLRSDGVRRKQVDELVGREAGIGHARENLVDRVLGQRDKVRGRHLRVVRASGQELEARAARAVAHGNGASELDAIGGGNEYDADGRRQGRLLRTSHRRRPCA